MDKLNLIHPSLGLAFTAEFCARVPGYPPCFVQGNAKLDALPEGCNGCRESISGDLFCCKAAEWEESETRSFLSELKRHGGE